jgi:NAD(P)-dependent dehydrogenase (short-subunit alcohol dehydrogenase family)
MVAIVTGAYKGLGFALTKQLALNGYQVILTARDQSKADKAADEIEKETGIKVYPKALEVTDESQLFELASYTKSEFGKIDLIINNAGINPKDYTDKTKMAKAFYMDQLDAQELLHVIHVNSIAPLLVVKHFRALLKNSNHPRIVNISSWLGSVTNLSFGGHYGYVGSKNLLNVFNKSMANELRADHIISVNVNPGWVQTDMGGEKAQFTPEQAAKNIINLTEKVNIESSGSFLNFDGQIHPW